MTGSTAPKSSRHRSLYMLHVHLANVSLLDSVLKGAAPIDTRLDELKFPQVAVACDVIAR